MHKQLLKISVFFHFHHSRTNRLCWYVGRAHQHCPPHNGESHKNHDAWKKERILSLAGGRTRLTGRYPERERTFSQKHSVKEQIKQWYVWLISGQQLLLFYSITKLLDTIKVIICIHNKVSWNFGLLHVQFNFWFIVHQASISFTKSSVKSDSDCG